MINSQLPYNQLSRLSDISFQADDELLSVANACRKALYYLDGYMDAIPSLPFVKLLQIADSKYSFELEDKPISLNRLFEANISENKLHDKTAIQIFNFIDWFENRKGRGLSSMEPVYILEARKSSDLYRDKKESRIYSYFTNLSLYSAPTQTQLIRTLRTELDRILNQALPMDDLFNLCFCHYQFRVLAPFTSMNGHVARAHSLQLLSNMGLHIHFLPFSILIFRQKETYNTLIRDCIQNKNYKAWCLFILKTLRDSANLMLEKVKQYNTLKKRIFEQLRKHTSYHLPAEELCECILYNPYIKPALLIQVLNCHRQTAYAYLTQLVKMGILTEKNSGREKLYFNRDLLEILSS